MSTRGGYEEAYGEEGKLVKEALLDVIILEGVGSESSSSQA